MHANFSNLKAPITHWELWYWFQSWYYLDAPSHHGSQKKQKAYKVWLCEFDLLLMITLKDPGDQNDPLAFFRGVSRVESLWGKCTVFPDFGTRDTDRWRINLHLCATWSLEPELEKLCICSKVIQLHLLRTLGVTNFELRILIIFGNKNTPLILSLHFKFHHRFTVYNTNWKQRKIL